MNSSAVLNLFEDCGALLRGHFFLSNGLHSDRFLQCAAALQDPLRAAELGEALAELYKEEIIDRVVSPALGGVLIGYEVARSLSVPFAFFEFSAAGKARVRRGFSLLAGERVLIVDDVVTDKPTLNRVYDCLAHLGCLPVGVAAIVDRSNGKIRLPVPVRTLVQLDVVTYAPEICPLCRDRVPGVVQGSFLAEEEQKESEGARPE